MNGVTLDETESRVAIAALQLVERELAAQLESAALPPDPPGGALPSPVQQALDRHDAVSALTIKLATAGDHWISPAEIEFAKQGLGRYVNLLATSIATQEVEQDDFLLDPEMQRRQSELAKSSSLLVRLQHQ